MRKPKIDPQSVIYCGNGNHAYLAYMAMFRYAFGRATYMPGVVTDIIVRNKENIPDRALMLINTELTEEADRYERLYKEHHEHGSNYGMECDREVWLTFHEWIKEQIKERSKK